MVGTWHNQPNNLFREEPISPIVQRQPHMLKSRPGWPWHLGDKEKSSYRDFLLQRCQKHLCHSVSTQERTSALTFPDLATFALWRPGSLLLDLHNKTPSPLQICTPFVRKALQASQLDKVLAKTWQNRAPKVVSHVQLDSHTLKRLKNFRILPSVASSPPWDVTPTMSFFHLFRRRLCVQEVSGHQHLSESMLKKSTSHPTLSTLISMKFLERPPFLSQPKQQKSSNLSIHPKTACLHKACPHLQNRNKMDSWYFAWPSHVKELAEMLCSDFYSCGFFLLYIKLPKIPDNSPRPDLPHLPPHAASV